MCQIQAALSLVGGKMGDTLLKIKSENVKKISMYGMEVMLKTNVEMTLTIIVIKMFQ